MTTTMNALASSSINYGEFVKLTTSTDVYTFCNAAAPITVNGTTYSNLGSLLSIGDIKREMKATAADLSISLTGVDGSNVAIILAANIKGSKVEVWRGFFDSNNQIITTPTQQFFKRYQGYVSNYSITEDWNDQLRTRIATCAISCASFRTILQNRISGIATNPIVWKNFYSGDKSMDRVPVIAATYFDFGKPPIVGSQSTTDSPSDMNTGGGGGAE
ncbi:hypothetical protein UFOVP15_17 [uncultured Caudovirales phage]|uniref:Uncharacterized protein n=1 Tax=uncultured Caudovirales phage TaxID=2100421 RepID=A0A6J5KMV3_9CAUD|nr:hypothetical protein UFOVP15_17 [uncultured Caudovirales phage]